MGDEAESNAALARLQRGTYKQTVRIPRRAVSLVPSSMTGPGWKSNPYFQEAFRSMGPPLPGEGAREYAARVTATNRSRPAAKPVGFRFTVEGFARRQRELTRERARARIAGR